MGILSWMFKGNKIYVIFILDFNDVIFKRNGVHQ